MDIDIPRPGNVIEEEHCKGSTVDPSREFFHYRADGQSMITMCGPGPPVRSLSGEPIGHVRVVDYLLEGHLRFYSAQPSLMGQHSSHRD